MHPELRALVELQAVDDRIAALKRGLGAVPGRIESENKRLGSFEAAVAEAQGSLDAARKRQRETEREIQAAEQRLREARGKQVLVKTNDEFRALNSEIARLEGEVASLEDSLLGVMDGLPAAEKKVAEAKRDLESGKGEAKTAVDRYRAEADRLEKGLKILMVERQNVLAGVSPAWRERYARFYKGRNGLAVCAIVEQTCQGCQMSETLARFFEIRDSGDTIFACSNCGRILYYRDAVSAAVQSEEEAG
ncbi:MAG: hypothetical protein AABZ64_18180 [Nitrospinota bacterium]